MKLLLMYFLIAVVAGRSRYSTVVNQQYIIYLSPIEVAEVAAVAAAAAAAAAATMASVGEEV